MTKQNSFKEIKLDDKLFQTEEYLKDKELTKILLEKGCTPLLYTDQNYPNSNKAYANTGYENGGTLVCFTCEK